MIYLDYNATAPIRPAVKEAMLEAMSVPGNASSVHRGGRHARHLIEQARRRLAEALATRPNRIFFTSGGTEGNNIAFRAMPWQRILISASEHDSVLGPAAAGGATVEFLPLNGAGLVDGEALEELLGAADEETNAATLVSVMWANNETGLLQPVGDLAAAVRRHGARFHCDAVQALGKTEVSADLCDADFLTLSAHKIGGPQGVGALMIRDPDRARAVMHGGGQERGLRPGTENVAGIAGFAAALDAALADMAMMERLALWRDEMERAILDAAPEATIYGRGSARLANTSCIRMPGVESSLQVMSFDLEGIAVSAGSACSSGKVTPSHVLTAMGAGAKEAGEAIRISGGWDSRKEDFRTCAAVWTALYRRHCGGDGDTVKNDPRKGHAA